jgi:hypothetical protein
VQDRGLLLGLVTFQNDGGDKHPSLDRIRNGEFTASRLRLRFDFTGLPEEASHASEFLALNMDSLKVRLQLREGKMGDLKPGISWLKEKDLHALSFDWFPPGEPRTIRWSEANNAYCVFTLAMAGREVSHDEFRKTSNLAFSARAEGPKIDVKWGPLSLQSRIAPGPLTGQDQAFSAQINGRPVPLIRLSDEKLTAG